MNELNWIQMRRFYGFLQDSIRQHPHAPIVLSEGDSWFAYPIHTNIIDYLDEFTQRRMSLLRMEGSGADLLDILNPTGLGSLRKLMSTHRPDVLLFSAGGNDIAGPELLTLLASRTEPFDAEAALDTAALRKKFTAMRKALGELISTRDTVAPRCLILTHGYANAIPTGKGAHYLGFSAGPWLKPFLKAKGYDTATEQRQVVAALMRRFNAILDQLSDEKFIKVDVSSVISDNEWSNELHPTRHGFEDAAHAFLRKLHELLPDKFPAI